MADRNVKVEEAVGLILSHLDTLSSGGNLGEPASSEARTLFDDHTASQGGSVRLACVFLTAYAVAEPSWDFQSVPTGIRGKYGDKRLAGELTARHVTFHNSITAFGENLGWKGNVRVFNLSSDPRFAPYLSALQRLDREQKTRLLGHAVWRLHSSIVLPQALPPLPENYLSYAKSLHLCEQLLGIHSEGHIQQFLVAAFLEIHRNRIGNRITTHHPHAADTFDRTLGDIEEFRDGEIVAAYEVTVRDDWKNRLADFGHKAEAGNLPKYIIFASNVRSDAELHPAQRLLDFVGHLTFDLAVVDLSDFFAVFCAELTRAEIGQAFNRAYQLLSEPRLSGREGFLQLFRGVTNTWLDAQA